ncbi:DNA polymerase zeta, catalytic subunit [Myxozyma melibiosi]|uniref:DNA polymerase n=1 Tax=Myxozyma melibiosi TaxID=54550 RepID=A0ABR1F6X8_9ASCO
MMSGIDEHAKNASVDQQLPIFRVQLNCLDTYQSPATSYDRDASPLKDLADQKFRTVPVIRVFGNADTGQKVCAHIHGVYPYLFIEYRGPLDRSAVDDYIKTLTAGINSAFCVSLNNRRSKNTFVANIILCKAVPFYGFHVGWSYYLKIYILDPGLMNRLADLLRNGAVLGSPFDVYEAHIPYLLQFFIDFNLYGCAWMNLSDVRFRSPVPASSPFGAVKHFEWDSHSISPTLLSDPSEFQRASYCELEVDIQAQDILNRYEIKERNLHQDFIELRNPLPDDYKYMTSTAELWKDERSRRKLLNIYKQVDTLTPEAKRGADIHWREDSRFWKRLNLAINADAEAVRQQGPFRLSSSDQGIMTAFNLVDNMFLRPSEKQNTFSADSTYEDSFWDGLDPEELAAIDDQKSDAKPLTSDDTETHFAMGQTKLKRKALANSSTSESLSNITTSPEVLASDASPSDLRKTHSMTAKRADRTQLSITELGEITKLVHSQSQGSKKSSQSLSLAPKRRKSQHSFTFSRLSMHSAVSATPETALAKLEADIRRSFGITSELAANPELPPKPSMIMKTLPEPKSLYQQAYYGNDDDVPSFAREYGGREFKLEGKSVRYLPDFNAGVRSESGLRDNKDCRWRVWQYADLPPSRVAVQKWLCESKDTQVKPASRAATRCQITGPTQISPDRARRRESLSFKYSSTAMSVMSLELHVNSRGKLLPDPKLDPVTFVVWIFQPSSKQDYETSTDDLVRGMIAVSDDAEEQAILSKLSGFDDFVVVSTELELLNTLTDKIREHDPDILAGFEIHNSSWGYLVDRSRAKYEYDISEDFSRLIIPKESRSNADRWGATHASSIHTTGRHVLNLWRLLKGSADLLRYTLQNCAFHFLKKRIPFYDSERLSEWYQSKTAGKMQRVIRSCVTRAQLNLEFLDTLEIIDRTSEQARVLGVDFYSVISRGSQYKVESLMFRIAKAENFMLVSPSRAQVGRQNALVALPIVMEPDSNFFTSPVVILDFQSLYPSIITAFNYCYSTCLGRVEQWNGRNKLGFVNDLAIPTGLLSYLKDYINISPNGLVFLKKSVRRSLLSKMLSEVLDTRVMVKNEMKRTENGSLRRLLGNRQQALKFISVVTYGYTSASFSGRMPCAELADAIVETGREMLERAIEMINTDRKWGARVVYGDTDSMFVHIPGRTKDEAFDIGKEIADRVTAMYPQPVKLKLEKVYLPCILMAKKRYVGFMYETKGQKEPVFDAKGIETVRRDGTPAEQKIEEKALRILFRTSDLSAVKAYFTEQCTKIMSGDVSIQDFCFSKAVKLGTYSGPTLPPSAAISVKKMHEDARAEPQYGERVPYVVVSGAPGSRLVDRCVAPEMLLNGSGQLFLDAEYYITKNLIPPLERIFNLVGANVRQWYETMPKVVQFSGSASAVLEGAAGAGRKGKGMTLHSYMKTSGCVVCGRVASSEGDMCESCSTNLPSSIYTVRTREREHERNTRKLEALCRACTGAPNGFEIGCVSQDCAVYYSRVRELAKLQRARRVSGVVMGVDRRELEW